MEQVVIASWQEAEHVPSQKRSDAIELVVRCDCGFEARGVPAKLIPVVQRHGREAHKMDVTPEQVLAMARPA